VLIKLISILCYFSPESKKAEGEREEEACEISKTTKTKINIQKNPPAIFLFGKLGADWPS